MDNDTWDLWAFDGGVIKTLDTQGRFEGLAVPFGDADLSDKHDRFTAATDFGRSMKSGADLLYFHGLPTIGPTEPNPLADSILGDAEFKTSKAGIWMTGQMKLRDEYEAKVWEMAQAGKLGLSTGTAAHRVRRTANSDGTHSMKVWPIVEVSLTPTPAHPRTAVYAIKTLMYELKGAALGNHAESSVMSSAMDTLSSMTRSKMMDHMQNDKMSKPEKMTAMKACLDEHCQTGMKMAGAMLDDSAPGYAVKAILDAYGMGGPPDPATFLDSCLKAASDLEQSAKSFAKLGPSKRMAIKTLRDSLGSLIAQARPEPADIAAKRSVIDSLLSRLQR